MNGIADTVSLEAPALDRNPGRAPSCSPRLHRSPASLFPPAQDAPWWRRRS